MAKQPETKFKEKVAPILRALPFSWWVKVQMLSLRGIPDYIGCVNGKFVALELKAAKAKPDSTREKLQKYICDKITAAGGLAFARVDPENFDEVLSKIKKHCY